MKNNSKAMAKAQRIKVQIEELKEEKRNQEVIQYIDKEMLLRN